MLKKFFSAALVAAAALFLAASCQKGDGSVVINIKAQMPSAEIAGQVVSAVITADKDIFAEGNSIEIADPVIQDDFVMLNAKAKAADAAIVVKFNTPEAAQECYSAFVELAGKTDIELDARYTNYSAGAQDDGSFEHPYLIADKYQMLAMHDELVKDEVKSFKMVADVDLSGINWKPLNNVDLTDDGKGYTKSINFDGDGHTISNLTSEWVLSEGDVDLYAYPSFAGILAGQINNVTFDHATITTLGRAGGVIAGYLGHAESGVTANCSNVVIKNSTVNAGNKYAGILAGTANNLGILFNCGAVKSSVISTTARVGGLIGSLGKFNNIKECYAEGVEVTAGSYYAGGLIGEMQYASIIEGCHATGKVINTVSNYARSGGLIGRLQGELKDSYADVTIEGAEGAAVKGQFLGGLVGDIVEGKTVSITNCHAAGTVNGSNYYAGGLIGVVEKNSAVTIDKCYTTANVETASKAKAAGFISSVDTGVSLTISNSYATGTVNCGNPGGGFIGTINASAIALSVTNCYTTATLQGTSNGALIAENLMSADKVTCSGYIAWWPSGNLVASGNTGITAPVSYVGNAGTLSAKATEFGWNAEIWDLSGEKPVLK